MSIRVFDLIRVVPKLDNLRNSQIESLHYSNTVLCIGTSDGHILRYSINKSNYLGENAGFKSELIDYTLTSQRKPINLITIISELRKIVYLSDGLLNHISFADLQPSTINSLRLRNVTTYCFSERCDEKASMFGAETSILCVCIKSRSLQIFTIEKSEANFYKEINLPELCLQMEINRNFICVATENSYLIVNILNSSIQTLFPYDIENLSPFIANCAEGEFLLNCQGDLGMFASVDGQTFRPPIPWCSNCTRFQIFDPYVLCLCNNDSSIKIFNLTDLKLKQEIEPLSAASSSIKHLKYVSEDKFLLVSTSTQIFILNRTSMLSQTEQLLSNNQVDEAIHLFDVLSVNLSRRDYEEQMRKIKIKGAFIELIENGNYSKSEQLFLDANFDYRKIAKMLPQNISLRLNVERDEDDDFLDNYAPFFNSDKLDRSKLVNVETIVINLMLKSKTLVKDEEYVIVLLKLCIDCDHELLNKMEFFATLPLNYCIKNIQLLNESKRYHSVAMIYYLFEQHENAFEIWKNILDKKISDKHFPGFKFIVEQLSKCKDHQLVWSYVDWSMKIDQLEAVEIFTKRSSDELASERMRPEFVLANLENQNYVDALTIYLEYLIHFKNIKKDKFNTQLISIYLDKIINLVKIPQENRADDWPQKFEQSRSTFQSIIESPLSFRVQTILIKIKEYESVLQKECAILYGRIEEHEKALKILVYTLSDHTAAINYCLNYSRESMKTRKYLFNTLLSIYTNPAYGDKEKLLKPTLDLLSSKQLIGNFDAQKVIEMLPNNWSMKLAESVLQNALQNSLAKKRSVLVQKNIAVIHKFNLQKVLFDLRKEQLYVDEDCLCFKCHESLHSPVCTRHTNGKLSHTICKNEAAKINKLDY